MAQRPDLTKYLDAGAQFVAMTRAQARARAKELVGQGQLAEEQVQGFVDELVDESRRRTDDMLEVVRREIQRQAKSLGFVTKDDLARLEARVAGKGGRVTTASAPVKTTRGRRVAGAKKSPTTKRAAKKTGAKKVGAKKIAKKKIAKRKKVGSSRTPAKAAKRAS